jgi:hypothetical protein
MPVRVIAASAGSAWPTPKAQEDGRTPEQWEAARMRHYETRKSSNSSGGPASEKGSLAVYVQAVQQAWATPTVQDGENNGGPSQFQRNTPPLNAPVHLAEWPTPHANAMTGPGLHGTGGPNLQTVVSGKLNPDWAELLMGYPPGWTLPDGPRSPVKRSTRTSRRARLKTRHTAPRDCGRLATQSSRRLSTRLRRPFTTG